MLTLVPFEKDISFNSEKAIQFAQLLCVLSKKSVSSGLIGSKLLTGSGPGTLMGCSNEKVKLQSLPRHGK